MLTYQVEPWATFAPEAAPLFEQHWKEIALDQDVIPLRVDAAGYETLDAAGMLHVVTVREAGVLVGYWVGFVKGHLHYRDTLHAHMDVVWLAPAHRKGLAGYRLLQTVERTLRALGVVKIVMGCKLHHDLSRLYARLGYTEIERTWSKVVGRI